MNSTSAFLWWSAGGSMIRERQGEKALPSIGWGGVVIDMVLWIWHFDGSIRETCSKWLIEQPNFLWPKKEGKDHNAWYICAPNQWCLLYKHQRTVRGELGTPTLDHTVSGSLLYWPIWRHHQVFTDTAHLTSVWKTDPMKTSHLWSHTIQLVNLPSFPSFIP